VAQTSTPATAETSKASQPASEQMSLKAKICATVCGGLFTMAALCILRIDIVALKLLSALFADLRIPAGVVLAAASVWLLFWAFRRYPRLAMYGVMFLIVFTMGIFWRNIATTTGDDGTHPVALSLIITMLISTLLLSCCAAVHFGTGWGKSRFDRFISALATFNFTGLVIAGIPVAYVKDRDYYNTMNAAQEAFSELHIGQTYVDLTNFELSGKSFQCHIDANKPRCWLK
jgi:hypothetical protein